MITNPIHQSKLVYEYRRGVALLGQAPREDRQGEQRLAAYLVPNKKQVANVSEIRRFLRQKLPEYMVPSRFILLDALPLLPNGKVDRRALPEPGNSRPDIGNAFCAPVTPVEEQLAEIWAGVLDLDRVGIHDSFLDLGGNSLLASQVISRVVQTFRVDLPLRLLFEAPTVAEMTVAIVQSHVKAADQRVIERLLSGLESFTETSI